MVTVVNHKLQATAIVLLVVGMGLLGLVIWFHGGALFHGVRDGVDAAHAEVNRRGWPQVVGGKTWGEFRLHCFGDTECRQAYSHLLRRGTSFYLARAWADLPWWSRLGTYASGLALLTGLVLLPLCKRRRPAYDARFATRRDLRGYLLPKVFDDLIPVAKLGGRLLGVRPDAAGRGRTPHLLFTAGNGSGKSAHLTSVLLSWRRPVVVVDIKGELRQRTGGYRQTLGPVFTVGPTGVGDRFDPVAFLLAHDPDAGRTIAAFIANDPGERTTFFNSQAENALLAALRGAVLAGEPFFPYIDRLMRGGSQGFVEKLRLHDDAEIEQYLQAFLGKPSANFGASDHDQIQGPVFSVWQTLNERLKAYRQPRVLELFSGSDFELEDLLQPSTLYLTWPQHYLDADAAPLSLVLHSLVTALSVYADAQDAALPRRMLFALDEASQYQVPALPKYISTMQGRGMFALIYVQSSAQLGALYGDRAAQIIRDNCKLEVFYQPQPSDALALSERLGKVTLRGERRSKKQAAPRSRSKAEAEQHRPLLTPDELTRLPEDEALVFIDGRRPAKVKKLLFFKEHVLRARAELAPPALTPYAALPSPTASQPRQEAPKAAERTFIAFDAERFGAGETQGEP